MLLVGQSLLLHRGRLARALAARDPAPPLARARRQVTAGAGALDLNAGAAAGAEGLAWATVTVAAVLPGVPLWLDAAAHDVLAATITASARAAAGVPLVANALAAGPAAPAGGEALVAACARAGAGVVVSPRGFDSALAPADARRLAEGARHAAAAARAAGVAGPVYLDALAWPPARDGGRCGRSLAVLRLLRDGTGGVPLAAVGNTGHGLDREVGRAVRRLYAAAAVAAGAGALILPVEEAETVRAVRLATGDAFPADAAESYLATAGQAVAAGEQPHPPPALAGPPLREAWRLLFQAG